MKTIRIHPAGLANMHVECAGQKYRPSNGTEGEIFFDAWCRECARDRSMSEGVPLEECDDDEVCGIISRTFAHDVDDPEYPHEWQCGPDGQPRCTAFVEVGEPIPEPRCACTIDMFEETNA